MATAQVEEINDHLVGGEIAAIEGRQLGGAIEVSHITLRDGRRLVFDWHRGTSHRHVGLRIERPESPTR